MDNRLPLPTLLSQVLVAFTIEFDNEFELQMPHRTTNHGSTGTSVHAPWLVSLAMWENCMRYVGEDGVTVRALEELARTTTNLLGMERWGYIAVKPASDDPRPKPPPRDWVIRSKPAGRKAQEVWRPLFGTIESRWQTRFGSENIDRLRESLSTLIGKFDVELPDCLPILGYGLFSRRPDDDKKRPPRARPKDDAGSKLPLSALLSRVLLAFALEFEHESDLSLAVAANVVRILDGNGVRMRDLPRLSGVAKEQIQISVGWLQKRGYAVMESDAKAKATKLVRLTPAGHEAQAAYEKRLSDIEAHWRERFGKDAIRALRDSLERLAVDPSGQASPLFGGLEPYPSGWRAAVPRREVLPHYPMVTHRGGFPDGS